MGKEKTEEQVRGANRLNNHTCRTLQVASKVTVLPFINKVFDVGYAKLELLPQYISKRSLFFLIHYGRV